MTELRAELAELVADLRAHVEDLRLRGATWEPEGEEPARVAAAEAPRDPAPIERAAPVPVPEPPRVASPPTPVGSPPVAAAPKRNAWSAIAEASRSEPLDPALALRRIQDDLGDCRRCGLCHGRRNIVFGVGDPSADLVVVGEGPGEQEDRQGEPFVGPAGEMLDRMLAHVLGLQRSEVYICNVVKCRPPQNRNPEPDEVAACMPFLERQIEAVAPKMILVLGAVAFRSLFAGQGGILANRGKWRTWRNIPALPTFHPAYLLRKPEDKRLAFEDLKAARARYDQLAGKRTRLF